MINKNPNRAALTREICDLAQKFGQRVENPSAPQASTYEIHGIVRVTVEKHGLHRHFNIYADTTHIRARSYRGQIEGVELLNGRKTVFDHIAFHTRVACGMIMNQRQAAHKEKQYTPS